MISKFYGDNVRWFIGIIVDVNDPLKLDRVKVRVWGIHTSDTVAISNNDLPWASVCLPVTEGGSLVIKEAIDLNLPILASNIPCHKEMLGHGYPGFFESEDHKDLSRKLQSFIVEKKIRESWKTSLSNSPITNYGRSEESKLLADVIGSLQ